MKTIRTFVAIELSEELKQAINTTILHFQGLIPSGWVKWVPTKNLHLTLKFLGDTPYHLILSIQEQIDNLAKSRASFSVLAGGAGMFPSSKKPRMIWIGLDNRAELSGLSESIEDTLERISIPRGEKPFSPHLTIGRVYQGLDAEQLSKIGAIVLRNQPGEIGNVLVSQICLIKSDLYSAGPVYSILHRSDLATNGTE